MSPLARMLRRKPLDALTADGERPGGLKRALGRWDLVAMGVGAIVGAGIFLTVGTAAAGEGAVRPGAGPAIVLSFLLTGLVCALTALCYAELAAMIPISGSAYTYAYATLGELVAWIIGWDLLIEYAAGNVAVAISWSGYFQEFLRASFGAELPAWLVTAYRTASPELLAAAPSVAGVPIVLNAPAIFIVLALTWLLVLGAKESSRVNVAMVLVKLVILVFFVAVSLPYFDLLNWFPAEAPSRWAGYAPNGVRGVVTGASIVFFAYIGFDAVSTAGEECRDPKRDLPFGILGSLVLCTFIYMIVAGALTGMADYRTLGTAEPLATALSQKGLTWATALVAFGAVVANAAVLLVFQMGQPRIFFAMARDGLLPPAFTKVHPRYGTPHLTTIATGVAVAALSAVFPVDEIVDLTNIGTLFAFVLVAVGVLVLRVREPERERPFRVPAAWIVAPLAAASCVLLMAFLPAVTWVRFGVWLAMGLGYYASSVLLHARRLADGVSGARARVETTALSLVWCGGVVWASIAAGLWSK